MAVSPPVCDFGAPAPGFRLPGTDGRAWSFEQIRGPRGTLILFICNHCPYVMAVLDRILRDAEGLIAAGIGVAAISSNDVEAYPEDSFLNMVRLSREKAFPFPYLFDESQEIAKAYGAVCTPDFFGYNAEDALQYRGRLDASGRSAGPPEARRELYEAMLEIAETGRGPADQIPSMGCSIKWKNA
ncbi:thioredoxin family protein [Rhodobacter xanthinilyticus]|uniref:Thioredoxin family protein n=1 Tax=Rhodobacter xanthinilyticus TaxID=1850250 RepID=A0A1D9MCF5_9RHOB|nr:thioredoxin family protein [Rhodobacter xanthinilyticus]AOZ69483.1 thioredoxin family protein [Rhodobacter xanthinilyticus]